MGFFKGILKSMKAGIKMLGVAAPALVAMLGLSLTISGCSTATPSEEIYKSYRDTEMFKVVYMEDVEKANQAFQDGIITNSEYQSRIDRYNSDAYLKEKIKADTEHPEYNEAIEKENEGMRYVGGGLPTFAVGLFGGGFFYSMAAKKVIKSAKDDFQDAKDEFKNKKKPKPKTAKGAAKFNDQDEEVLPNIEDEYYN